MPNNQLSPFASAAPSSASGAPPSSAGAAIMASGGRAAPEPGGEAAPAAGGTGAPETAEGVSREEFKLINQKSGAVMSQFMALPEEQKPLLWPKFLQHAEGLGLNVSRFPQQYDPRKVDLLYAEIVGTAEYIKWVEKREKEHTFRVQTAKGPIMVTPTGPFRDALLMGLEAGTPEFKDYIKKRPGPLPR